MSIDERSKASGENILFYVVLLAILVVANIVGVRLFWRADLTANEQYSLSDASVQVVRNLDDKLVVKAYFTRNLPPPFNATERYVRDLLQEYESRSKGRMKVVFIDPSDETTAEEARQAGITEVTHQVIEKDQASEKKGFRGMLFSYLGETQKIPVIRDTKGLEYDITNIIMLMSQDKRKVGFLQGHGEPRTFSPPQDPSNPQPQEPAGLAMTRAELQQYQVRDTNLSAGSIPVSEELEALVIVAPQEPISDLELFRIDQFIMKGGNVAFFTEGIRVDTSMGMLNTKPTEAGYEEFLAHFGVKINQNVVFDPQCDTLPVRGPLGIPLAKRYPGWPMAEIRNEHPSTFRLPVLTFPWVSSLEILDKPTAGNVKATILARSTPESWTETGDIDLDPNQDWKSAYEKATNRGQSVLAVAIEGTFKSFFDGKDLPKPSAEAGALPEDLSAGFVARREKPGRILVAGSGQMVIDPVVQILQKLHGARERSANLAFTVNTVDWLTANEGLIAVRVKGVENPRLNIEKESTRTLLKYGNILGWPLLVIAIGLAYWSLRTRRRSERKEASPGPARDEDEDEAADEEAEGEETEKNEDEDSEDEAHEASDDKDE
ncbi:MAG: GldG family protein [Deltaproteobacteria bacterium]|nr:GldG family protein [Deltaproteobacteria bacterium]